MDNTIEYNLFEYRKKMFTQEFTNKFICKELYLVNNFYISSEYPKMCKIKYDECTRLLLHVLMSVTANA